MKKRILSASFHNQESLKEYADRLLQKYPGSNVIVEFGRVENGQLIHNEHFDSEICQETVYRKEYSLPPTIQSAVEEFLSGEAEESDCEDEAIQEMDVENNDVFFDYVWKDLSATTYKDAIKSWQHFYVHREKYWYIFKEKHVMLIKPFGKEVVNSLGKRFYALWKYHFGSTGFITSVKNCRAYSTSNSGKSQWILLYREIFGNASIMGHSFVEPDWNAIIAFNSKRKYGRNNNTDVHIVKINL